MSVMVSCAQTLGCIVYMDYIITGELFENPTNVNLIICEVPSL